MYTNVEDIVFSSIPLEDESGISVLSFSGSGALAVGSAAGNLFIIDRDNYSRIRRIATYRSIESVVWHPSMDAIFVCYNGNAICLQYVCRSVCPDILALPYNEQQFTDLFILGMSCDFYAYGACFFSELR